MRDTDSLVMTSTLTDHDGNVVHTFIHPHEVCPECLGSVSAPFPGGWRSHLEPTISMWTGKRCEYGLGQKTALVAASV